MATDTLDTVSALIVNYKSALHVIRCVKSLRSQDGIKLDIIIVDNDSGEQDVSCLADIQGDDVTVILNPRNDGFGRANNLAAAKATGGLLLIINPDTEFCSPHDLARLCDCLKSRPETGMVGPDIFEPDKGKNVLPKSMYPDADLLRFTQDLDRLPGDIAWLLGACLLIRKDTFESLGGFDEDYFLYGEDVDLCIRTRKAGLMLGYCTEAHIRHVGGASAAMIPTIDKFVRKKRGYFLFCQKHYDHRDVLRIARRMRISSRVKLLLLSIQRLLGIIPTNELLKRQPKCQAEYQVSMEILNHLVQLNPHETIAR